MVDDGEDVVASPLDAARRDHLFSVVLGMVDVAVLHVGQVEAGNVAKVAEDAEVGVAGNDARLEDLLANDGGERMRGHLAVGLDHPGVVRAGLEDELPAAGAARLQVDKGLDIFGPLMLGDKTVTRLEKNNPCQNSDSNLTQHWNISGKHSYSFMQWKSWSPKLGKLSRRELWHRYLCCLAVLRVSLCHLPGFSLPFWQGPGFWAVHSRPSSSSIDLVSRPARPNANKGPNVERPNFYRKFYRCNET